MGLMTVLENRIAELEDPSNALSDFDPWRAPKTAAGPRVTTDNAKANTAVFAAIKTISNSIAALPIKLYQRNPDGSKNEVREHPSWDVTHNAANDRMTAADFKSWGQGHLLTRGNLYAEVTKNGRGQTDGLFLLNPDRMDVRLSSDGETVVYIYRPDDGQQVVFMGDEVLHIKGMGGNGLVGWSPIEVAREAISHGLAIQEFSARFFGNSSQPSGILTTPNSLSKEASDRLKQQWEEAQSGLDNAHRVAVLEEGLSWEQMGLSARDSQLIQSEKLGWRKVAQIFGIPPHKIGDLEDATFSNISEQNLEYLQDTLQPWIVRWEQALNRTLLTRRERRDRGLFFEFVMDALLRGDSSERANMIETRMQTGTWTINEVREMENEDPLDVPGADEPMVQMQMVPISQAVSMSPDQRTRMLAAANGEPIEERSETAETRQTPDFRLALRGSFHGMILDRMETMVGREANDIDRFAERLLVEHDPEAFVEAIQSYYLTGRGDSGEFVEMARDLVSPVFDSYVDAVSAATARELDEEEPDLADFAEDYTQGFIRRYAASSRRQLQKLAREAAQSSEERQQDLEELTPREAVEERTDEWREGTDTRKPRAEKWTDRESVQLGEATAKTAMAAVGVQLIRWMSVGDSCPFCRQMTGSVVGVQQNFVDEGGRFDAPDADTPLQFSSAIGHPPLHPGCWTPDHDIFTANGWKPITDVERGDRLWTMDMETRDMELDCVQGAWSRRHEGKIGHVSTRTLDMKLTPDHQMAVVTGWRHKYGDDYLERRDLEDTAHGDAIPRVPEWSGPNPETIEVAGREWDADDAMQFVGWYLAEGTISEHGADGLWQAGLRQHDDTDRDAIGDLCERLFDTVWRGQDSIYVPLRDGDPMVGWMRRLGHSGDRFIPSRLLRFGSETLRPMFDALIAGDGSVVESKWNDDDPDKQGDFRPSLNFSTSSERLASDMTELALKVGLRPTVKPRPEGPRTITHENGTYTAKKVQHQLSFGRNQWSTFKPDIVDWEPYEGAVIGLSMENNPVVLVRRNGKTSWVGNCDCTIVVGG